MMTHFFNTHRDELIATAVLIIVLLGINIITTLLVKKIGTRSNINEARISLICRYVSVSLFLIGLLIEGSILGAKFEDIAVIFSSVFAILGIALFAVWSILSNVTSGIIMFFNFPYKIGDKIEIHDKDFPIKAIIEDIRAFHLHLKLENGDFVTYPNNLMLQKAVTLVEKDAFESDSDDGKDAI
jgi:small-conductance mechanosensitive channel